MHYRLLESPEQIRQKFIDSFAASFAEFTASHGDWISNECKGFDKSYFEKMFLWDKVRNAREISFGDALELLRGRRGDVLFLTESPNCCVSEFCELNNKQAYVAAVPAAELAECAAYEWFTGYELAEQEGCLVNPILPSDLYIFDDTFSWCFIFTHEADETETAESRLCLYVT